MDWLMKAGGAPMWFIAIVGAITLLSAARFARRTDERLRKVIGLLARAILYAVGAGITSDLAAVAVHVPARPEWAKSPDLPLIILEGIGESMAPGILGFTLLSLGALLTAIGVRRMPRES